MTAISPTQSNVQAALRSFLLAVLPGLPGSSPAIFTGSISGTTLTVSSIIEGVISPGAPVLGAAPGTQIIEQLSGNTGGIGTYQVSPSQNSPNPGTMATGVDVIAGQANRVPESAFPWFVVMTPIRFERLATNVDQAGDVKFVGSIAGSTMTVSSVDSGEIATGAQVFGVGVATGTTIIQQLSGTPGGTGTYQIAPAQTVSQEILSAGQNQLSQNAKVCVQLDFHAPDNTAGDLAQIVSTALRDEYAVDFFAELEAPLDSVVPLYADDPKQVPFINDQEQWEWRWVLEAYLEADQIIYLPQQYADSVVPTLVDVPAAYPP